MSRTFCVVLSLLVAAMFSSAADAQWIRSGTNTVLQNVGDQVGIGTSSPVVKLDVGGWTGKPGDVVGGLVNIGGPSGGDAFFGNAGAGVGRMRFASNSARGILQWNLYYMGSGYKSMDSTKPSYEIGLEGTSDGIFFRRYAPSASTLAAPAVIMSLAGSGRVGINTSAPTKALHVVGDVLATGTISGGNVIANYQDLAEWVPSSTNLDPGTVVVLNKERTNEVTPSNREYDTLVAGVVSERPGVLLGIPGPEKEMVATTGRVRVRVDASRAPIEVGDLLVTSGRPGMAMKSIPMEIAGRTIHQPGTIIGKALEPLADGEGEILVLLSMQ